MLSSRPLLFIYFTYSSVYRLLFVEKVRKDSSRHRQCPGYQGQPRATKGIGRLPAGAVPSAEKLKDDKAGHRPCPFLCHLLGK